MNDSSVKQCPDGKYRWIYEVNLFSNPTVMIDVIKVMSISVVITWAFVQLIILFADGFDLESFKTISFVFLIMIAVFAVLTIISYLIYAAIMGGRYIVMFEMDDYGIVHKQMPRQMKKAQAIGVLGALAGLATGNLGAAGAGVLAASRSSMVSSFQSVKRLIGNRRFNRIKVNATFNKNRVYVEDDAFMWVYEFIRSRCPNAKAKLK
ncbi:MAG: hypothetical protein J6U03_00915 [Muribaculaceae bacterium]|nr:hypothetical protein [Muribaculaceae bacterium]